MTNNIELARSLLANLGVKPEDLISTPTVEHTSTIDLNVDIPRRHPFVPKVGQTFWWIDAFGLAVSCAWKDSLADQYRLEHGNCFETIDRANQHIQNVSLWNELRQRSDAVGEGWTVDSAQGMIPGVGFSQSKFSEAVVDHFGRDAIDKLGEWIYNSNP